MEDQMIRKLLNWRNCGWKADLFFSPLLSIIVPVGIQKKWEIARDVQQWIFFRERESIPKRVINALLAVALLLENRSWKNIGPVITRFWKGRALKKKKNNDSAQ